MRKNADEYYCIQCSVHGNKARLHLMRGILDVIDGELNDLKNKYKTWEEFRVFTIKNPELAKKLMEVPLSPRPNPKRRVFSLIGSMEVGAFLDWFVANVDKLSTLSWLHLVIPFFMFFQGILFIAVFWRETIH
jgi:hypothetical protein